MNSGISYHHQRLINDAYGLSRIFSLQCRLILGGRNLVRVRNILVAAIFDFMTLEDWGE